MDVYASVVIPTKNAMPRFVRVLRQVLAQETPWPFEVIVIDSGSSDGTLAYARAQERTRCISIHPSEFGHGRTRNRAIGESRGRYVALLTHDAEPRGTDWLVNIVAAVEQDERVGGAFGRHIAYPEASPFTKRDIAQHFEGFLASPLVVHKGLDVDRFQRDMRWRQFLHFYSDNNSCLRRSVWEQIPYPDVEFAEDQLWAMQIIEAGYHKAYAPDAVVYHSHDYSLFERLQRSFDEARAFRALFSYALSETLLKASKAVVALSRNDFAYSCPIGTPIPRKKRLLKVLDNLMLVLGHYLGQRSDRMPSFLCRKLSRDKRLFAQR